VVGDVVIDYDSLTVTRGDEVQELPQKEFMLLYKLLSYPGKIFTRIQLMDEIWGSDSDTGWETVTVHIGRLRRRFDGWDDQFDFSKWMEAFEECGIDPAFYANRRRSFDEILPWDHLDYGVSKKFLIKENEKAHNSETTKNCREKCAGCGANKLNGGVCDEIRQNMV
jgi:hypothetical protein